MSTKRFQVTELWDQGRLWFQVADTHTGELMDLPGLVRKRTSYRDKADRIADAMNDAHPLDIRPEDELAQDLYPVFVALVDWSRKAGRTEVSSVRAARAALRAIGTSHTLRLALVRRYAAGSRATADLHREGRLT